MAPILPPFFGNPAYLLLGLLFLGVLEQAEAPDGPRVCRRIPREPKTPLIKEDIYLKL